MVGTATLFRPIGGICEKLVKKFGEGTAGSGEGQSFELQPLYCKSLVQQKLTSAATTASRNNVQNAELSTSNVNEKSGGTAPRSECPSQTSTQPLFWNNILPNLR